MRRVKLVKDVVMRHGDRPLALGDVLAVSDADADALLASEAFEEVQPDIAADLGGDDTPKTRRSKR